MKILIPVAEKIFAKAIIEFVKSHQWPEPIEFKIVHVLESVAFGSVEAMYTLSKIYDEDEKAGRHLVDYTADALAKAFPNCSIEKAVTAGIPHKTLLQMSNEWRADMIVMGSHGRTGFNRFLMGSVSQSIISHARCSVVVVRIEYPEQLDVELSTADLPGQLRGQVIAE